MTKPIPDGFHAITPELVVSDADGAERIAAGQREFLASTSRPG